MTLTKFLKLQLAEEKMIRSVMPKTNAADPLASSFLTSNTARSARTLTYRPTLTIA